MGPNSVHWEHFEHARPGRWGGHNDPTYLNAFLWFPSWSNTDDASSGPSLPLGIGVTFATNEVVMAIVDARAGVQIFQQPDPTNGFTLIVEFNDDPVGGAAWYEIVLSGVSGIVQPLLSIRPACDENACVALSWESLTNRHYQLQYAPTFPSASWLNLGSEIQGNDSTIVVNEDFSTSSARFYRLVVSQ